MHPLIRMIPEPVDLMCRLQKKKHVYITLGYASYKHESNETNVNATYSKRIKGHKI